MNIRNARKAVGLTQAELARRVGCDQSEISRLERGERLMSVRMLTAIARALEIPPSALLADDDSEVA